MIQYNKVVLDQEPLQHPEEMEIVRGAYYETSDGDLYIGASTKPDPSGNRTNYRLINLREGNRWRDDNKFEGYSDTTFVRVPAGRTITITVGDWE